MKIIGRYYKITCCTGCSRLAPTISDSISERIHHSISTICEHSGVLVWQIYTQWHDHNQCIIHSWRHKLTNVPELKAFHHYDSV